MHLVDEPERGQASRRRTARLGARHRQTPIVYRDAQCPRATARTDNDVVRALRMLTAERLPHELLGDDAESGRTIGVEPGRDRHGADRVAEDVGAIAGEPLGLMHCHGVAVVEAATLDVREPHCLRVGVMLRQLSTEPAEGFGAAEVLNSVHGCCDEVSSRAQ